MAGEELWSSSIPIPAEPALLRHALPTTLSDALVVTLWAPSGCGKSTLAARLVRSAPRVSWCSLVNTDRTLGRFAAKLAGSMAAVAPRAALALRTYRRGALHVAQRYAEALSEDTQPLTVVIDDIQMVDDVADVQVFMNTLIAQRNSGLTLVLISGLLPRFDYTPLAADQWRNAGTTDFLLTLSEVRSLVETLALTPNISAQRLLAVSGGRVLHAALLARYPSIVATAGVLTPEAALDIVFEAIWRDLADDVRRRLREIAHTRYAPMDDVIRQLPEPLVSQRRSFSGEQRAELHALFRRYIADRRGH